MRRTTPSTAGRAGAAGVEGAFDARGAEDLLAVHREQDVARPHARARPGAPGRQPLGDEPLRRLAPEDPVVHEGEGGLEGDVVDAQRGQGEPDEYDQRALDVSSGHGKRDLGPDVRPYCCLSNRRAVELA